MTIAVGLLATDGFVIGADSEVSVPDYMSIEENKISALTHFAVDPIQRHGNIVVTGSGEAGYLEGIYGDLEEIFKRCETLDLFETEVGKYLKDFYREHVIPFAAPDRPDVYLIIGAKRDRELKMWTTRRNRLVPCRTLATAVGIGEMYAKGILRRISHARQTAKVAMLMASYVIHLVKDRIPGCGKDTYLACVTRDSLGIRGMTIQQQQELEDLFKEYGRIEATLLHRVLGSSVVAQEQQIVEALNAVRDAIDKAAWHPLPSHLT